MTSFFTNSLGTPDLILVSHAANQFDSLGWYSARVVMPCTASGEELKCLSVPSKDRGRLHNDQRLAPGAGKRARRNEHRAVNWGDPWSLDVAPKDRELLTKQ
jgi:hypothetical protein